MQGVARDRRARFNRAIEDACSLANEQFADFTLRRDSVRLALSGRTTVAEAMRVSNQS